MSERKELERSADRQHGFTLIEGLIAMLVMAFGILALVNLQHTFRTSSDDAKLRTEATRLAQQKLDELRAYEQIAVAPGKFSYLGNVVSSASPEVINLAAYSNTTFNRAWTVTTSTDGMFKTVSVNVTWADRLGNQTFSLNSVIGRADPSAISTLGVGPGATVVRRPKNRNINIPYPAVGLQGGKSAFKPAGSNVVIVFDNSTGDVLGKCNGLALPSEGGDVDLTAAGCDTNEGYLLSGFIRFCLSSNCGPNQPGDAGATFANAFDPTAPLDGSTPLSLDTSNQTGGLPSLICYSARQVVLKSTGATVSDTGQADNQVETRFISYACIVYPVDHDSNTNTRKRWWGKVTINPDTWSIASGSSNRKVCRFSSDLNGNGTVSNSEHPLWYRGVTGALDSQNFLVVPGNGNCPNDKPVDPTNGDFSPANTVTHQTSGATGGVLSFHCLTITCNGANQIGIEPTTLSADIPME